MIKKIKKGSDVFEQNQKIATKHQFEAFCNIISDGAMPNHLYNA